MSVAIRSYEEDQLYGSRKQQMAWQLLDDCFNSLALIERSINYIDEEDEETEFMIEELKDKLNRISKKYRF